MWPYRYKTRLEDSTNRVDNRYSAKETCGLSKNGDRPPETNMDPCGCFRSGSALATPTIWTWNKIAKVISGTEKAYKLLPFSPSGPLKLLEKFEPFAGCTLRFFSYPASLSDLKCIDRYILPVVAHACKVWTVRGLECIIDLMFIII